MEQSEGTKKQGPTGTTLDPVIQAYLKDVDKTLLIENLKLSPEQRLDRLQDLMNFVIAAQEARAINPHGSAK